MGFEAGVRPSIVMCNKTLDISKARQTLHILAFNFFNVST